MHITVTIEVGEYRYSEDDLVRNSIEMTFPDAGYDHIDWAKLLSRTLLATAQEWVKTKEEEEKKTE